ncbi:MAG: hypothetical protein O6761_07315 [Thaumarchaeota archaeon]|nr:MAG: hypothetical protein NPMRIOTA_40044 [Nitrosopumilales archaeon]MCZ6582962.1 hypothetical protein [Nitrososphaerota archaeon]GFN40032.1 MAG: conserved hypothetical protein [Marine Group I thaumarchaeote]
MKFKEIYCHNCKKVLGRYNEKYFPDVKIAELIKSNYASHIRDGHEITIKLVGKKKS